MIRRIRPYIAVFVFIAVILFYSIISSYSASAALAVQPRTPTITPLDTDKDGVFDVNDNCPNVANADQKDSDAMASASDGKGDACDNCPFVFNPDQESTDDDHVGSACDNCPYKYNEDQKDSDDDGVGDACDPTPNGESTLGPPPQKDTITDIGIDTALPKVTLEDSDDDSIFDVNDNCVNTPNEDQKDTDNDGFGDACDTCKYKKSTTLFDDQDNDAFGEPCDNCPETYNPDQKDSDWTCASSSKPGKQSAQQASQSAQQQATCQKKYDGAGDACDVCPGLYNPDQKDTDDDGIGDACDGCPKKANANQSDSDYVCVTDVDGNCHTKTYDNVQDACDNCPAKYNPDQKDTDWDGVGDSCDNCVSRKNPDQADWDGDGAGDMCDTCPFSATDKDKDGVQDLCDSCPNKNGTCNVCTSGVTQWGDDIPGYWDWRYMDGKNLITSVKDQGACGSCYAQASMGAIESLYNFEKGKTGNSLDLSEQYFVSQCFSGIGSCFGGYATEVMERVQTDGVPDDQCLQYQSGNCVHSDPAPTQDDPNATTMDCNFWCEDPGNASVCADPVSCNRCSDWQTRLWKIGGYQKIKAEDRDIKVALLCNGPLVICSDKWWHCVDLVGYDDVHSVWVVKNSWGYGWGDGGFGYIPYENDDRLDFKKEVYRPWGIKKV